MLANLAHSFILTGGWITFRKILFVSLKITGIVFILMIIVEILEIRAKEWLEKNIVKRSFVQYLLASVLGIIPGCSGAFLADSFYMSGVFSFGAMTAALIATSGDEAFVMLAMASDPTVSFGVGQIAVLWGALFLLGILFGAIGDTIVSRLGIQVCKKCEIASHPPYDTGRWIHLPHFLTKHIWEHIIKKHIWKIFLWLFGSILVIEVLGSSFNLQQLTTDNLVLVMLLAGVVGIAPISGPNLLFLTLFAKGMLPFSVLLVNSIVQDGHGLLPLLGFSLDDSFKLKFYNLVVGYLVGFLLLSLGL